MVQVGLVNVEVHHAGVGAADLRDVGIAEAAAHLGCLAPVFDLVVNVRIAAFDNARNDRVTLAGTLEVSDHFADRAAGVELAKPGGSIGVSIVGSFLFLNVDQNDRHIQIADSGEHIVACCVGQKLQDHKVHIGCAEFVARGHGHFLSRDKTAVNQLNRIRNALFEFGVLRLELRNEGRELGQIRAQRDGEDADTSFGVD